MVLLLKNLQCVRYLDEKQNTAFNQCIVPASREDLLTPGVWRKSMMHHWRMGKEDGKNSIPLSLKALLVFLYNVLPVMSVLRHIQIISFTSPGSEKYLPRATCQEIPAQSYLPSFPLPPVKLCAYILPNHFRWMCVYPYILWGNIYLLVKYLLSTYQGLDMIVDNIKITLPLGEIRGRAERKDTERINIKTQIFYIPHLSFCYSLS